MINPNSYYTVQAWMVNDLGLHGNELALYAIIYGFSQDGRSAFTGSISYIEEWLGCSRSTVKRAIAALEEKKLIIKKTSANGTDTNTYKARLDVLTGWVQFEPRGGPNLTAGGSKMNPGGVQNEPTGGSKMNPNNYIDNNSYNYIDKESSAAGAPAPAPGSGKEDKPVKHKYGEYSNVLLTDEEHAKLLEQFGAADLAARIERLSEYIASKGTKYKSHYATIRSWANRDRKETQHRPAGRGGYGPPRGNVGPNGIAIDPNKNDLDGYM